MQFFGDGAEDDVRRQEDEQTERERQRRRIARLALAHKKHLDAERKRAQASYQNETEVRKDLLREAAEAEKDARRLKSGEIGLLEAMGISTEDRS